MKKRKLKKFVLPTVYVLIVIASFLSIAVLNNVLLKDITDYDYSKPLLKEVTQSVIKEEKEETIIFKPYVSEKVKLTTAYYSKDDEDDKKQNALIFYQNTYMPSSGVFYSSAEEFDVVSVMDGEVTNITEDDILGIVVEITHNTNLTTYYYSLKDVPVNIGNKITAGTIIGRATINKIKNDENNVLFEVYYQGKSLDPEKFYTMNPDELQ